MLTRVLGEGRKFELAEDIRRMVVNIISCLKGAIDIRCSIFGSQSAAFVDCHFTCIWYTKSVYAFSIASANTAAYKLSEMYTHTYAHGTNSKQESN